MYRENAYSPATGPDRILALYESPGSCCYYTVADWLDALPRLADYETPTLRFFAVPPASAGDEATSLIARAEAGDFRQIADPRTPPVPWWRRLLGLAKAVWS